MISTVDPTSAAPEGAVSTDADAAGAALLAALPPDAEAPEWLARRQAEAREEYARLAAPSRQHEGWRFADLKKLDLSGLRPGALFTVEQREEALRRSQLLAHVSARLVLGNDQPLQQDIAAADGIVVLPLREALRTHGALIEKHFMAQGASLGGEKFYALHAAACRGGAFIYVPDGVEVEHPIEIHQWLGGTHASAFPHTLIIAGKHAKVTVVDSFQSVTSEPGFACGVVDLVAGDGAALNYVYCQRWSRQVRAIHFASTTAGRDAQVKTTFVHLGAAWSRTESFCLASGEGSRSEMFSLAVAEGVQEMDCRTRQIHHRPQTFSNLLFKNVLFDRARTIFSGLIFVEEGAHFTDAYQTCRNLLLSDEAEAMALPGLEINADQVKCSHGSTSGPLSDEEVYYLRSRGLPEDAARHLLALGFCRDVLAGIGHEELEEKITQVVEEKFRRMKRGAAPAPAIES